MIKKSKGCLHRCGT